MFKGSITALITPFKNGKVDEKAFQSFCAWQIEEGTDGLVPCGTTGESPTLSHEEHGRVVELAIEVAKGKVPVIAGTGSNSTAECIAMTRHAKHAGADAVLIVTPYYNKPTQEGIYQHFKAVNDQVDIPIIVYNIPGRSVVDISHDTMVRLARLSNVVGVKDATTNLGRPAKLRVAVGAEFCQLSGEDDTAVAFLAQGGVGCISVTSNVAPRLCARLQDAWAQGDMSTVNEIRDALTPLNGALFCESSPGPVKYAAQLLGKCSSETRQPLWEIADSSKKQVEAAMKHAGVL